MNARAGAIVAVLAIAVLGLGFAGMTGAQTQTQTAITGCQVIDQPGTYVLNQDLTGLDGFPCLEIRSSDVTIDGQGHTFAGSGRGIVVSNISEIHDIDNIEITNMTLENWDRGAISQNQGAEFSLRDILIRNVGGTAVGIAGTVGEVQVVENVTIRNVGESSIGTPGIGFDVGILLETAQVTNVSVSNVADNELSGGQQDDIDATQFEFEDTLASITGLVDVVLNEEPNPPSAPDVLDPAGANLSAESLFSDDGFMDNLRLFYDDTGLSGEIAIWQYESGVGWDPLASTTGQNDAGTFVEATNVNVDSESSHVFAVFAGPTGDIAFDKPVTRDQQNVTVEYTFADSGGNASIVVENADTGGSYSETVTADGTTTVDVGDIGGINSGDQLSASLYASDTQDVLISTDTTRVRVIDCSKVTYTERGDGTIEVGAPAELQCIGDGSTTIDDGQSGTSAGLGDDYVLVDEISLSAADVEVWDGGDGFRPIGNSTNPFTGTFDGANQSVANLTIDRSGRADIGLFGVVGSAGVVRNATLADANVTGGSDTGTVVGDLSGTLENVHATGTVDGGSDDDIGGLAGITNTSVIRNSSTDVDVSGNRDVGGIIGGVISGGTVNNSYATGNVTGTGDELGGLVGDPDDLDINNSYATGTVDGVGSDSDEVGGLAGDTLSGGSITHSYATGNVTGTDNEIGGLVGDNDATIADSYATGNVSGDRETGGLVGYNEGPITDSYATGAVNGTGNDVGGFVGRNDADLTRVYATGDTDGTDFDIGGLIGEHESSGVVNRAFATGNVTAIGGDSEHGGLVGDNNGPIRDSYATGDVASDGSEIGGLIGDNEDTVERSYAIGSVSGISGTSSTSPTASPGTDDIESEDEGDDEGDQEEEDGDDDEDEEGDEGEEEDEEGDEGEGDQEGEGETKQEGESDEEIEEEDEEVRGGPADRRPDRAGPPEDSTAATPSGSDDVSETVDTSDTGEQFERDEVTAMASTLGGLIGTNTGTVTDSYWDTQTTGLTTSDGGTGLSTIEMIGDNAPTNMDGFDFSTTWDVVDRDVGNNDRELSYPFLRNPAQSPAPGLQTRTDGTDFRVAIDSADRAVRPGDTLAVSATIENLGVGDGSQTIEFTINGSVESSRTVSIDSTNATTEQFTYATTSADEPQVIAAVASGNDSESREVLVTDAAAPDCSNVGYSGNGTSTDPFEVGSPGQLQCIEQQGLGASYALVSNIDASDTPIWNDFAGFDPIGDGSNPFTGAFDGAGHSITGLTINRSATSDVGLFGSVGSAGILRDVTLDSADVTGGAGTGSLVGDLSGTIEGARATGVVDGGSNDLVGGMVGIATGSTVSNTSAAVEVSGDDDTGGLVGDLDSSGSVTSSYATGAVSGTGNDIGGLIGTSDGDVIFSYATGNVTGADDVAGLLGDNDGEVRFSFARGDVSGDGDVGGLTGDQGSGIVADVYATGSVGGNEDVAGLIGYDTGATITRAYASGAVSGNTDVAGLVGDLSGTIEDSYWDIPATGQSSAVDTGTAGSGVQGFATDDGQGRAAEMIGSNAPSNMTALDFTGRWTTRTDDYPTFEYQTGNGVPLVADDSYTDVGTVDAPGVLDNDLDPDGDTLSITGVVSGPSDGNLTLYPNGSFDYRADLGFSGSDSFVYEVSDGTVTEAATVTITVTSARLPTDNLTVEPNSVDRGESVTVAANFTNPTGGTVAKSMTVVVDGVERQSSAVVQIASGETRRLSIGVPLFQQGDREVSTPDVEDSETVTVSRGVGDREWTSWHLSPENRNYDATIAGPRQPVSRLWNTDLPDFGCCTAMKLVVANDTVFGYSYESTFAMDARTGNVRWSNDSVPGTYLGGIAYEDDRIFVSSFDGNFYALDAETGDGIWSRAIDSTWTAPTTLNGTVFIAGDDSDLWALDAETGNKIWNRTYTGAGTPADLATMTAVDGRVFLSLNNGTFIAHDADTGDTLWTKDIGYSEATPAVKDGTVYIGDSGSAPYLHALNATTGDEEWNATSEFTYTGLSVTEDTVFVATSGDSVFAYDADTGKRKWSRTGTDGAYDISEPVTVGNYVYVTDDNDETLALNRYTGETEFTITNPTCCKFTSPTPYRGVLYFADRYDSGGISAYGGAEKPWLEATNTIAGQDATLTVLKEYRNETVADATLTIEKQTTTSTTAITPSADTIDTGPDGVATYQFPEAGTYDLTITAPNTTINNYVETTREVEVVGSNFSVRLTDVNSTVTAGDSVVVESTIENLGSVSDTQEVNFSVEGSVEENRTRTLGGSDQTNETFTYQTDGSTPSQITVAVSTDDDREEANVTVEQPSMSNLSALDIAENGTDATITQGDNESVDVTVENVGDQAGSFDVTLEIGTGAVDETQSTSELSSGETETLTFENVTGDLGSGDYDVNATTDDDEVSGTLRVDQPPTSALPTLDIAENGTDATITAGDNESVDVTVENVGGQAGSFDVTLEIGTGAVDETQTTSELSSGETETLTFENVTGDLSSGDYDVNATTADDEVSGILRVDQPATSALSTLDVAGSGTDATINEGENESVDVTVENVGDQAGSFDVTLEIGTGAIDETQTTSELSGGETESLTFRNVTSNLSIGDYDVNATTEDDEASGTVTVDRAAYVPGSLTATLAASPIPEGTATDLIVEVTFTNGTTTQISNSARLRSNDTAVAIVDVDGRVYAEGKGAARLTAFYRGDSASATLAVTSGDYIEDSVSARLGENQIANGTTTGLVVEADFTNSSTRTVTSAASLTSSDPSVATIDDDGTVTAQGQGSATLTATYRGDTATETLTVTAGAYIEESLNATLVERSVPDGTATDLVVEAEFTDGTTRTVTSAANLRSNDTGVATVGSNGTVTATGEGAAEMTATYRGDTETETLTVTAGEYVAGSLNATLVEETISTGETTEVIVTAAFTDGSTRTVTSAASLASNDTGVATVATSGTVTARGQGVAEVTATYQGESESEMLTVEQPAESALSGLDIAGQGTDATITTGDDENVTIQIMNAGDQNESFEVSLDLGGGRVTETRSTSELPGGTSETVTFATVTGTLAAGSYDVTVSTPDSTVSGTLTIEAPAESALSALDVAGQGTGATITEGDNADVTVNVTNIGDQNGTADVTLAFRNSTGMVQHEETNASVPIDAGETVTVRFTDVTGSLAPGSYDVEVSAADLSASDDSIAGTLTVEAPAESALSALDIAGQGTDATISEGESADVTVNITNLGDQDGAANVTLAFRDSTGTVQHEETNASVSIDAGETVTVRFADVTGPLAPGSYDVEVSTADISTSDDSVAGTLTVEKPAESALTGLDVGGQGANATIGQGANESVAVTVTNVGDQAASFDVTLDVGSGAVTRTQSTSVLAGGDMETVVFENVTGTLAPGSYDAEASTADDTATGSLTVQAPGEANLSTLDIAKQGTNATVTAGETANVSVSVENTGDQAESFAVSLSIRNDAVEETRSTGNLSGGETETLSFANVTGALGPGTYPVTVSAGGDVLVGTLTVEQPATPAVSALDVAGQGANATITGGVNESVAVTVENLGDQAGSFDVSLDIGSGMITGTQSTGDLASGETETVTFANVTGGLAPGNYAVTVSAGGDSVAGTLGVWVPPEGGLSGLDVAGQGANATIVEGTDGGVSVAVTNGGEGADTFQVSLDIGSGAVTETRSTSELAANETERVRFENVTGGLAPAEHTVSVSTSEDTSAGTLSVLAPPASAVSNLTIGGQASNATVAEGANASASIDVENTGQVAASFSVTFKIGSVQKSRSTGTLASGESETVTVENATGTLAAGTYSPTAATGDDTTTGSLQVLVPAAFELTSVTTESAAPGENANVTATIRNVGEATATKGVELRETTQLSEFADGVGVVTTTGLLGAIQDWRAGAIGTTTLLDAISAWRSGEDVDGTVVETTPVTLDGGERTTVTLTDAIESGDGPEKTYRVRTDGDGILVTVEID